MKFFKCISKLLVIVGGLNWLLVGLFSIDIGMIFGGQDVLISRIIYILVGLSAIYLLLTECCRGEKTTPISTPVTPVGPTSI